METKTFKVDIPEGYEIDKEKSTFENIVFKKVEQNFSKNWGEFCVNNPITPGERYITGNSKIERIGPNIRGIDMDRNLIPEKFAEPMLAFMQLLTIREKEYTKGWEPDWSNLEERYCVSRFAKPLFPVLSFPTQKLRDEFIKNWINLIEIAKPLL